MMCLVIEGIGFFFFFKVKEVINETVSLHI